MALAVDTVSPRQEVQTADVETAEEKLERKWLDLLNRQMNFCLGLTAHAITLKCADEIVKVNVLAHLGHVIGDTKKSFEGFCPNLHKSSPSTIYSSSRFCKSTVQVYRCSTEKLSGPKEEPTTGGRQCTMAGVFRRRNTQE